MSLYDASSRNIHRRDIREDELHITIENLRCELLEVAEHRSLSDRVVLELSERLDSYILLAQNKMMENLRNRKAASDHPSVKVPLRSTTALQ